MNSEPHSNVADKVGELEDRRRGIDRIDRTIVALLSERVRLGREIGAIKRELDAPVRVPEREAQVLDRVRQAASGRLSGLAAERIFSVIIAETMLAQQQHEDDDV
jgi:chorismate mutase